MIADACVTKRWYVVSFVSFTIIPIVIPTSTPNVVSWIK